MIHQYHLDSCNYINQFVLFPGVPQVVAEKILRQRGFAEETAKRLAVVLNPILFRLLKVPLAEPFAFVQGELSAEVVAIKNCFALDTRAGVSVVAKAFGTCCTSLQRCLLTQNILVYHPGRVELAYASPLSQQAFDLVVQKSSLALVQ